MLLLGGAVGQLLVDGLDGALGVPDDLIGRVAVGVHHRGGSLCGRAGLLGRCRRSVAGLGVGRDGVLDLLCEVLHPECIDLGLIHHVVAEGPVGVRLCSGLSDLNACSGDGRRRAGAVQAADKALNEILAPLHSLPRQGFYPADRAGNALLHGLCHRRRHAFDAAGQPLQDVCPEIQPVEGGDHRDDGLHDLAHILDDERDAVDKAFAQLHHEADRTG